MQDLSGFPERFKDRFPVLMNEAKEMMALGYEYLKDDNEYKIAYDDIMRA